MYNVAKARGTNKRKEPAMKTQELISQIKQSEKDTDNFYASHFNDLVWDIKDGMEEGYIEGIKSVTNTKPNKVRVECEDGVVWIHKTESGLEYHDLNDEMARICSNKSTRRTTSPYERTRAMVYATGNKWAIENFNAVH
jgi:hypothetical protein